MSPRERVRRMVDGELDAAGEARLLADAERDAELRQALEDARILARAMRALEPPEPPSDLVNRAVLLAVQRRAAAEARTPAWQRWLRPRFVRFRLTPSFVLLAGVALTALGLLALPNERPTVREERARERAEATEALVRLVLPAEGAGSVAVAGDFNGWQTDQIFLEDPEGDGVFVGTLRLRPGSYGYMFVIDGERWVTDPYAVNHRDDGFGNRNAVLRID